MNTNSILIGAGVTLAAVVFMQKMRQAATAKVVAPGVLDGTNWTGSMSQRLSAMDLIVPGFLNLGSGVNAIPAKTSAQSVGLNLLAGLRGSM